MSDEELVNVLKTKCLPTFGTKSERADWLRKHYGLSGGGNSNKAKVVKEINKI